MSEILLGAGSVACCYWVFCRYIRGLGLCDCFFFGNFAWLYREQVPVIDVYCTTSPNEISGVKLGR